jgi:hypothetical protein
MLKNISKKLHKWFSPTTYVDLDALFEDVKPEKNVKKSVKKAPAKKTTAKKVVKKTPVKKKAVVKKAPAKK